MDKILTGDIWKQVSPLAKDAKRRLVAVAYVTTDGQIGFRQNDVLICDASDRAIENRETSARLLQSLYQKGVELRSRSDLHAKVAVLGRHALIGSCNLSTTSAKDLTELALLSDRKQIVAQATAFIHALREESVQIDDDFLRRILKIKVKTTRRRKVKHNALTPHLGNKVWIVSVNELAKDSFPKEQISVQIAEEKATALVMDLDSTISWIRFTGKSRFRATAQPGDIVVQIWKPIASKRISIFEPCPIIYRQDVGHWTRFYVEETEYCRRILWERFKEEINRLGLSRVSKNSVRELNHREVLLVENIWK